MRSPSRWIIAPAMMLALAGGLRAQEPAEAPKDLLKRAMDQTGGTKGFHIAMSLDISFGSEEMPAMAFTGTSTVVNPDFIHSEMEFAGMMMETYTKDGKTAVMNPMTQEWTTPEEMGGMMPSTALINPVEQFKKMLPFLQAAAFEADEKVGDAECRVVTFSVSGEGLKDVLGEQAEMMNVDLSTAKMTHRVWIGKTDSLVRKIALNATMTLPQMPGMSGEDADEDGDEGDELTDEHPKKDAPKKDDPKKETPPAANGGGKEEKKPAETDKLEGHALTLAGTFSFTDYDKNLDISPPAEVREKLGLPKEKESGDAKPAEGGDAKKK